MCGKLESRQVFKLTSRVEFKFDKTTLGKQAPEWIWKKQTNEIVLTKTSLSVPRTNPFSEALFCVDNVVLFCYVQSRPLAVVEIHHGGHKRFGGRRDKSRRPLDMRSRKNIRNLTSGSPPWITNAWCLSSLFIATVVGKHECWSCCSSTKMAKSIDSLVQCSWCCFTSAAEINMLHFICSLFLSEKSSNISVRKRRYIFTG